MIAQSENSLQEILGEHIWGFDNDTLEDVVGALLAKNGLTIATMESFTGNLLASTLSDALQSSNYYKGGFFACSNETMIGLGVDAQIIEQYGVVSAEVAEAMAVAVRQRLGADIGVGITGASGSDRIEEISTGLVYIAIVDDKGKWIRNFNFPPQFQLKHRTTSTALFGLRQRLLSSN
jgi:nicotinamide-nucleotide amidase